MRVTVLGSGTMLHTPRRRPAGLLIRHQASRLLLDAGPGTLGRLVDQGLGPETLDAVLLTHFHPDHTTDLVAILFALQHPSLARPTPLPVLGPPGLAAFVAALRSAWPALTYRDPGVFEVIEWDAGERAFGPLSVTPGPTVHSRPCQGYRLTAGNRSLAYTGDTARDPLLLPWLTGVDLLMTEASTPDDAPQPGHMTPSDAAELARQAGAGRLVLLHLYPECDERADLLDGARATFDGPIEIAEDGQTFGVP